MPTTLPQGKPEGRLQRMDAHLGSRVTARLAVALKFAMVVSVLLLGALVQISMQINAAVPHHTHGQMTVMLDSERQPAQR